MCGRYTNYAGEFAGVKAPFRSDEFPQFRQRYNSAPSQDAPGLAAQWRRMRNFLLACGMLTALVGCIPATAISFPPRQEVLALSDPTEMQLFNVPLNDVLAAARASLLQNGFDVKKEEPDFIYATERIWARMWSWNYTVGVFLFDVSPQTRVTVVINGAPDLSMILSLGLGAVAQSAEARQMRIQLLNSIRVNLALNK